MKKMVRAVLFAVMAVFSTAVFAEDEDPCASLPGSLTFAADGYYEIGTADALYKFACMVNGGATSINGRLTADIVVNENLLGTDNANVKDDGTFDVEAYKSAHANAEPKVWTPIGTSSTPYTGTFDGEDAEGNVHVISGLYFNDESTEYVGLFGYIDESAKVQNVGVVDSYFKGCQYVGGVVGYSFNGTVSKVYNTGAVSGETYVGGVVGYNDGGTVSNAYNTGSVSGSGNDVGGVVGANYGTVSNAYNTGSVSGSGDDVGGVVGYSFNGTVSNVYNTGSVSGNGVGVGGVVGNNYGTVSNVYNTGSVNGTGGYVGGVVGDNDGGTVENAYYNTDFYTGNAIGENGGGRVYSAEGKPTAELASTTLPPLLWVAGSGEQPVVSDGKLVYKLPGLIDVGSQPEIEYTGFQPNADGYYEISNAQDLKWFAQLVNSGATSINGRLTADICVNACGEDYKFWLERIAKIEAAIEANEELSLKDFITSFPPIGTESTPYTGTFDGMDSEGNTHVIGGVFFGDDAAEYVGLFGYIGDGAKVQNVGVVDSYIRGGNQVGGVVGFNWGGSVSNVYSAGIVKGAYDVGGVIGYNGKGFVSNVYNSGDVSGVGDNVGGVVGNNRGTLSNVYNAGAVSGLGEVGGVVGNNRGTLSNAYNTGSVSRRGKVGGVVGNNDGGSIENAYYNTDSYTGSALGENVSGSIENVDGKTTVELASTTLPDGFSSEIWVAGSGESFANNGKLVYKLPGLKNVGSQPEIEYTGFRPNADGFYEISTAQELKWFAQLVNGGATDINGKLTADICVNACGEGESVLKADGSLNGDGSNFTQWTPIGTKTQKFEGTFDGAGHTISGLYVDGAEYAGLFGYVFVDNINGEDEKGVVKNVGIEDSHISGTNYVGGVVAYNEGRTLSVYNAGNVTGSGSGCATGGVVGYNVGLVSDAYNARTVKSSVNDCSTGGVVGLNAGFVFYVYNIGAVSGGANVGGVAGSNSSMISKAYYNTEIFTGNAVGSGNQLDPAAGKTSARLSSLNVVSDLCNGDPSAETAWIEGSGRVVMSDNKLVYKLPGLKGFSTQPEIVLMQANDQNVFEIGSAQELKWFAEYAGSGAISINAKLTANICLNACGAGESVLDANGTLNGDAANFEQWTPINIASMNTNMSLDGNGHTISGLYFRNADKDSVGFFGSLQGTVSISNLGIEDSYIEGKDNVGVFVGVNDNSNLTIANCFGAGYVKGNGYVAGFVGQSKGGLNIANSYSVSIVNGEDYTGGFIGSGALANVANSFFLNGVSNVGGTQKSADEFHDGTVAVLLHNYNKNGVNGLIWGQDLTNANSLPDFSSEFAGGTLHALTLHTFDGDTRKYPTEYVSEIGLELPKDLTRENYVFAGWSTKQVSTSMADIVTSIAKGATGAKTFYAQWMKVSEEGVYEIATAVDLYKFAQLVNSDTSGINGRLTANICLNACGEGESVLKDDGTLNGDGSEFTQWTPIGTTGENKMFKGTFDGAGHTISGLYFNQDASYAGLFGKSTKYGSIKNVGVVDSYIKGMDHVGGIVGHNGNCTVSNVFSTSTVEGGDYVGGIAGYNEAGTIVNAYNMGAVSGAFKVGGIAGQNDGTTAHINNVYSSGTVSGPKDKYVRGLVGYNNDSKKNIDNAYYNTDVFLGMAVGNVDGTNVEGKTSAEFADGTVVLLLRNWCEKSGGECKEDGLNGSVWGQNLAKENSMPDFSGEITGTLYPLTWVTYDDDTRTYPTEYIKELGLELPTDLTRENYVFAGWSTKQIAESSADIVTSIAKGSTGAKTFYAQWMKLDDAGCYEIASVFDLQSFAAIVNDGSGNVCGRLTANICLNACGEDKSVLNADGTLSADSAKFISWIPMIVKEGAQVSLNGGGHIIRGLYVNSPSVENAGLFGSMEGYNIYRSLYIDSLGIEDSYIKGTKNAGAFVGNRGFAGMLTITNSHHKGVVVGSGNDNAHVGGLIGDADGNIRIENSFNSGSVIADNAYGSYAGGLIGRNYREAVQISNSYNVASISVKGNKEWSYAGGLIAYRWDSQGGTKSKMTIVNSYNAGAINVLNEGITAVGGIVAYSDDVRNITNSFFLGLGENFGSIGKPAEAFKNGAVAAMLHNYKKNGVDGSVWGQGEVYPDFSGVIPETIKVHPLNLVTYDGQTLEYPSSYVEGDAFDLPRNPVRDGYVFAGWSSKEISESAEDRVASIGKDDSGDKTFYAQWIAPKNGCFEIGTTEALFGFAAAASNSVGKICGKLTKDIVINENVIDAKGSLSDNFSDFIQWTPIYVGSKMEENGSKRAEVTFDGNGHTIHGMYVKAEDDGSVGMFTGGGGVLSVSNLGIVDSYFGGKGSTGSIMGYCGGETISISNFYTAESVIGSGFEYVSGGFIGSSECDLTIRNSFNASPVKAGHTDDEYSVPGGALVAISGAGKFIENSFFIGEGNNFGAIGKSVEKFKNGVVATLLHNYKGNGVDGSIWGQKQDAEFPDFSGKVSQTVKTSKLALVMYDDQIFEGITAYVEGDAVELPVNLTREGYIFAGWSTKKISESAADMVASISEKDSGDKTFYAQWVAPADGCFEIATAEALYGFATAVNKGNVEICGKLTADIVVNEGVLNEKGDLSSDSLSFVQWTPIGTDDNPYMGDFDGAGHTISGLYLNDMFREYVGLFGKDSTAKVRNVGVVDSYFNGSESIGGIVGSVIEGSVTNVYTSNIVVSGFYSVGGVIGYIEKTELHNVSNLGTVRALDAWVGGVVGFVRGDVVVSNVYSVGKVSGLEDVGGVVGYSEGGIVSNSFFNKDLFDGDAVGSNYGGSVGDNAMGKTTAEFTADTLFAGLDPDVWSPGYFKTGAARDTMFYPYLKDLGRGSYVLGDVKKYAITVAVNDKAMGSVTGAGEYEYGTKVEISATAKKGYKFVKWSDGVKDAKRTITVTKAEKLTATFEKDSKKDAVIAMAQLPQFSVTASGKMVSIAGARPNTNVVVYDLQGNTVKTVVATSANFTFALPSAGVYIVKNGYTAKRVNVR